MKLLYPEMSRFLGKCPRCGLDIFFHDYYSFDSEFNQNCHTECSMDKRELPKKETVVSPDLLVTG